MQPETKILFFDIPTRLSIPTSPNTWKVRLALNYKGLQYTTKWVQTVHIESVCKLYGIPPTARKPTGEPHYTLPALIDYTRSRSEPTILSDSTPIIEHLESRYPSHPSRMLFPPGTRAFHAMFENFIAKNIYRHMTSLWLMDLYNSKTDEDRSYFRRRMEAQFGKRLEDIEPHGAARENVWNEVRAAFAELASFFAKNGSGVFAAGERLSFPDFALGSCLITLKLISPHETWGKMSTFDNGKWVRYYAEFERLMVVNKM
ncbi:hypothetical protein BDQ17DRAFT_1252212 [Cyathus striatus]|nr:hypothetical protein BDQ17DRAFT_1252212 [Cyathus striatus]